MSRKNTLQGGKEIQNHGIFFSVSGARAEKALFSIADEPRTIDPDIDAPWIR